MTPQRLIAENKRLKQENAELKQLEARYRQEVELLKWQLKEMKKVLYGAKSERRRTPQTVEGQLSLFDEAKKENGTSGAAPRQRVRAHERRPRKKHPGREALPEHLPEEVEVLEPEEDTSDMVKIGEERTEWVEYTPGSLVRKVLIRPKYARPDGQGVLIAPLPARPLDKSIAGASLLAHVEVEKFVYHQPFYRQIQRFSRHYGWKLSPTTLNDWHTGVCGLLELLYELLWRRVLARGYIQVDESPIKVLSGEKKGSTHQGYQWVYYSPQEGLVCFRYRRGRGAHGPREDLAHFAGYVQCDGYKVYDKLARKLPHIELVGCWVHARRKFQQALNNHPQEAQQALDFWQRLYKLEAHCRTLSAAQRRDYRQMHHVPLVNDFRQWVGEQRRGALPKSPLGQALHYFEQQWQKLERVFQDGRLELDNNLIENKIRPLALGRKNYLFAGSHSGAQRIAMMYSFFGSCLANHVEPFAWLEDVLNRIATHPVNRLEELLPSQWKQSQPHPRNPHSTLAQPDN